MSTMVPQIIGVSIANSTVCSGADQRKHQSSASLAFVRGIHRWPVNSPHKGPVTRKIFPFDDVIMSLHFKHQQQSMPLHDRWSDTPSGTRAYLRNPLLWRHNGCDGVSNHQPHDCLLNRSFRPRSKKTSKLRVTGLCVGNSPVTGEFPAQMASNAENVSIWWRHHALHCFYPEIGHGVI